MTQEKIFVPSENRSLRVPMTEWVIYVPAEFRKIEVR